MDVIELLPEELTLNIFSRISLKPRTRLKCVSKRWCAVVTSLRKSLSSSSLGILLYSLPFPTCDYQRRAYATLLRVQDQGRKCLLLNSYQLPDIFMPRVLTSCKSLVLYHQYDEQECPPLVEEELYVVNPLLQQCRLLPRRPKNNPPILFACIALSSQQHFRVIINTGIHRDGAYFYIFESEKWEWKEQYVDVALDIDRTTCFGHSIFHNEKMYMICVTHMAIYNFKDGILKFTCLLDWKPCPHSLMLWVSEEKLYYCVSDHKDVIHIRGYDEVDNKWRSVMKFARDDKFSNLKLLHMDLAAHRIKFVAFHDDLQILYIRVCHFIIAYSFETRKVTKVWGYKFPMDDALQEKNKDVDSLVGVDGYPFVFEHADLSIYPVG